MTDLTTEQRAVLDNFDGRGIAAELFEGRYVWAEDIRRDAVLASRLFEQLAELADEREHEGAYPYLPMKGE